MKLHWVNKAVSHAQGFSLSALRETILSQKTASLKTLQKFGGKTTSFSLLVPGAKLYTNTSYQAISKASPSKPIPVKKFASSEQAKASDSASISHEDDTEISQFNTSHDDTVAKNTQHTCSPNNQEAVTGQHDASMSQDNVEQGEESMAGQHDANECL